MKFVSALLVAMLAMVLVVPALGGCTENLESCTQNSDCCSGLKCQAWNNGDNAGQSCRSKRNVDLGECAKEYYSCDRSNPVPCCGGWSCAPVGSSIGMVSSEALETICWPPSTALTQVRKNLLSALTMLEDN